MEVSILGKGLLFAIKKRRPTQLLRVMRSSVTRSHRTNAKSILLAMKLTAIIIVAACMHVSAKSYSQVVTFSGKNVPLQTVFASIEKQTGLSFFFNYAIIKDIKPVTVEFNNIPFEDALN